MSAVSESIVREYFEMHGFLVRQLRKYVAPMRHEHEEIDFLVCNPQVSANDASLPVVLASGDLARVHRAVVVVKGWHTETFSQAVLAHAPKIFRFVQPRALQQAMRAFGDGAPAMSILVVPGLPQKKEARHESIQMLRNKGIDAVIPFRTILAEIIARIEVNRNYQKSDLLQIIRVLKNYDLIKDPQLELFKPGRRRKRTEGRS